VYADHDQVPYLHATIEDINEGEAEGEAEAEPGGAVGIPRTLFATEPDGLGGKDYALHMEVGARLVRDVMFGRNGALIAFGERGSGKSFTMFGGVSSGAVEGGGWRQTHTTGLVPWVCQELVEALTEARTQSEDDDKDGKPAFDFKCSITCCEIYCERVQDLLVEPEQSRPQPAASPSNRSMNSSISTSMSMSVGGSPRKLATAGRSASAPSRGFGSGAARNSSLGPQKGAVRYCRPRVRVRARRRVRVSGPPFGLWPNSQ
jgi:hypothetical protein